MRKYRFLLYIIAFTFVAVFFSVNTFNILNQIGKDKVILSLGIEDIEDKAELENTSITGLYSTNVNDLNEINKIGFFNRQKSFFKKFVPDIKTPPPE